MPERSPWREALGELLGSSVLVAVVFASGMAMLPSPYREALTLTELEGLSHSRVCGGATREPFVPRLDPSHACHSHFFRFASRNRWIR
jgi:hypothetical protein